MESVLPILAVVGIMAAALIFGHYQAKKRRESLTLAAERLGLTFESNGTRRIPAGCSGNFEIFARGHSSSTCNLITGEKGGRKLAIFDYRYVSGSRKHRNARRQTIASITTPKLHLPSFTFGPEGIFHKFASCFGYQDIDLPQHPEFSGRYIIRGCEENKIRTLFSPALVRFLSNMPEWNIEGDGQTLIVYRDKEIIPAADLEELVRRMTSLSELFGG